MAEEKSQSSSVNGPSSRMSSKIEEEEGAKEQEEFIPDWVSSYISSEKTNNKIERAAAQRATHFIECEGHPEEKFLVPQHNTIGKDGLPVLCALAIDCQVIHADGARNGDHYSATGNSWN